MVDDDVVALLRANDPARDARISDERFTQLVALLRTDRGTVSVATRRRVSRGWVIGLSIAGAVLVGAPAAVAAVVWQAQTGEPVGSGEGVGGQWVDVKASDAADYLRRDVFGFSLPVPDGIDLDRVRSHESQRAVEAGLASGEAGGVMVSDLALREQFVGAVYCLWVEDLEQASEAGDTARAAKARAVIEDAPNWPAVAEPGSTRDGITVKDSFTLGAQAAREGKTSLWRYVPTWAIGGGCGDDRTLEYYTP